jgi:hypothetical protein
MKIVHIRDTLATMGFDVANINLGHFDEIGEFTAKKKRSSSEPNYAKVGAFFRPNYERGILMYHLIRATGAKSVLEIGHGRGYVTFCAAKAFHDMGITDGVVTSVDVQYDEKLLGGLGQVFPSDWFKHIKLVQGSSHEVLPKLQGTFDIVYVDGDHSYEGTKSDWENVKDRFNQAILFDDYHLPSKEDPGIQCSRMIDEIDWSSVGCDEPQMVRMDRRIFLDDRGFTDEQVDYGQVLAFKKGVTFDVDW